MASRGQRTNHGRRDRRWRPRLAVARSIAQGCTNRCPLRLQPVAGGVFQGQQKGQLAGVSALSKLLERKDIDAVIVGTAEFQRVLPCIHACQAGKDIYAEKPLTLYIHEGRVLVDAVRRHNRVLQVGSQQRSMAMNRIACELVRSGGLGKVLEVRAINYPGPQDSPAKPFPAEPVPAGLDWDVWLNQAAWRPFNGQWMRWTHGATSAAAR